MSCRKKIEEAAKKNNLAIILLQLRALQITYLCMAPTFFFLKLFSNLVFLFPG